MIVTCPNCLTKAKANMPATSKKPAKGFWGKCPKCAERFFIPAMDLNSILSAPQDPPARATRKPSRPGTMVAEDYVDLYIPIISPSEGAHRAAYVFVILGVAGLLIALFVFYNRATEANLEELSPPPSPVVSHSEYDFPQVKADLLSLRRQLFSYERVKRRIDYKGSESRVFKYLQAQLNLDSCQEIVALDMESQAGNHGFILKSVCLRREQKTAELNFAFKGGWVVVRDKETGQQLDVPLLPSAQRAWDSGQRFYVQESAQAEN
ncbi:MAG: zinc-ribbon domain-containing protein [Deltaproteobacteria bacterium]|nr:zinc-ribbon domain-containing protein [Deltaproteobacteria bacterium]